MENIGAAITIVGVVATLLVLFAAALVLFKGSYNKATQEKLRQDIADYVQREASHDRDMAICREEKAALQAKLESRDSEVRVLREAVTQRAAVEDLALVTQSQHEQLMAVLGAIRSALEAGHA